MAAEELDSRIAALERRISAAEGHSPMGSPHVREPDRTGVTVAQVMQMIETARDQLMIAGPGVTGNPKSGWAINPVTITLKAVCNNDGTITITATS